MPKDRRVNSSSFDRAMLSPYSSSHKMSDGGNGSSLLVGDKREWEEARCPICMEHPHNAVLLICSSSENGCRPFICDTSYRHSNCLDQLRKSANLSPSQTPCELVCPLCRGLVTGWDVINPARKFMNSKSRNCSLETCSFSGNYAELRKHARLDHPSKRPSEASPNRQLNWEALERQREMEDALAHQSDFDDDFDEWFNLHQFGDDIWSDNESFFNFSSGLSDIEYESIDELDMFSFAMSLFSLCPSSPDDSNLRSDNHRVGYMSHTSRPVSREILGFDREIDLDLNLNSVYHRDYVPRWSQMGNARSISSSHRENASNNVSSRSGYHRANAPATSSNARLSYPRENGPTASGLRSSNSRQNAASTSRARSSNFPQDEWPAWPSSSSRTRTTLHPRDPRDEAYSRSYLRPPPRMPRSGHGRRQG